MTDDRRKIADWLLPKLVECYGLAAEYEDDQSAALIEAILRELSALADLDARGELAELHLRACELHGRALRPDKS
jgi:hypothetical protein